MATYLFTDISDLKTFVGGGVNLSLELDSLAPEMLEAAHQWIIPWIGTTLWTDLVAAVAADNATPEETALLPYVKRPLAQLTLYRYSKIGGIMFSESGIYRTETETQKAAYKYQENQYREQVRSSGFEALERMLDFLEDNEGDYSSWTSTTGYIRNKQLVINRAADFRELYHMDVDRYNFETLRPIIGDIERFALIPVIGEEQFDEIKDNIQAKALTAAETTLLPYLQKPVAHFTIQEAQVRSLVTIRGNRVVQQEILESQGSVREQIPDQSVIGATTRRAELMANRHIHQLQTFLTANIDDYPLYKTWKEAQDAAEAAQESATSEQDDTLFPDDYSLRPLTEGDTEGFTVDSARKARNDGIVRL